VYAWAQLETQLIYLKSYNLPFTGGLKLKPKILKSYNLPFITSLPSQNILTQVLRNASMNYFPQVKGRKGPEICAADEHPRPATTPADLAKLKPVFKPDGGRVTAASARCVGVCD
jgi:Thiolase, N-terminal domain